MYHILIIVFLLTLIVITILWYRCKRYYFTDLHKFNKTQNDWPIVGVSLTLLLFKDILNGISDLVYDNGGSIKIMLGFEAFVVSTDYKFLEFVMSSNTLIHKSYVYASLNDWLGDGLLLSFGAKWRARRKVITPTFHFQILEKFIDSFESASQIMIDKLQKKVGVSSLDIYPYVTACALDVICETAMGTKVNAQQNNVSSYILAVKDMGRFVFERAMSPFSRNLYIYKLMPNYWRERRRLRILHGYTKSVIKSRRAEILARVDNPTKTEQLEENLGMKKKFAFLDLLLHCTIDGQPLTDADISEEVETFMFEGHDTTASGLAFCIYNIAQHPQIQSRLVAEQIEIFGDDLRNKCASLNDFQNMKYLEMVIKETLRLYPSVPLFGREVKQDTNYNGMVLRKGLQIIMDVYTIHRNPKFFPNPLKFDPERFSKENFLGNHPYSYMPFAAGSRNCIGQKFAMLELKCTISKVLRNFVLHPSYPTHKLQLAPETILKSSTGMCIQLKTRS